MTVNPKHAEFLVEHSKHIQKYVEYVIGSGIILGVEEKFDVSSIVPGCFGTADAITLSSSGSLNVIDLKYGFMRVHAEHNDQLIMYAVGAIEKYGWSATSDYVTLHIVQPRINVYDSWEVSLTDVEKRASYLRSRYEKAIEDEKTGELEFNPGKSQCRYCLGRLVCPSLYKLTEQLIAREFEGLKPGVKLANPKALSLAQYAKILDYRLLVTSWIEEVRSECLKLAREGQIVPGYKLVQGYQGNRAWIDVREVKRILIDEDYEHGEISVLKSPTQMALKVSSPTMERLSKDQITRKKGKSVLVPNKDKRKAIEVVNPVDMFKGC